jgi:hypothetical protein
MSLALLHLKVLANTAGEAITPASTRLPATRVMRAEKSDFMGDPSAKCKHTNRAKREATMPHSASRQEEGNPHGTFMPRRVLMRFCFAHEKTHRVATVGLCFKS